MPKLIHTMIRVRDLDRSIAFYRQALGLAESHRLDFPSFTLVYLREPESGFEIELTLNKGQAEPYTHGSGYGHVAFCVDDLTGHRETLLRHGYTAGDIKSPPPAAEPTLGASRITLFAVAGANSTGGG